jgi:glyoxylate/hydroxypyruvate reductase A
VRGAAPRVLVEVAGADLARWQAALHGALPEARFLAVDEREADYLVTWRPRAERFDRTIVRKAIFNLGAGVDALLQVPTLPADVPIDRLRDAGMAMQMAEYAVAAVLRAYRDLEGYAAAQSARAWQPRARRDKASFGVGVMGTGVLGRAVLDALRPFGFPLHGYARTTRAIEGVAMHAGEAGLRTFLSHCAVCICLLPATPATRDLFDTRRLAWLPRGSHLVNLARGELVVDADLAAALDSGHLGHATLDVFRTEPLPAAHPFWHHPRVTITPHVSALTQIDESAAHVAAGIRAIEAAGEPPGRVDRLRGY